MKNKDNSAVGKLSFKFIKGPRTIAQTILRKPAANILEIKVPSNKKMANAETVGTREVKEWVMVLGIFLGTPTMTFPPATWIQTLVVTKVVSTLTNTFPVFK